VTANYNVSNGVAPYTIKAVWGDNLTTSATQTLSGAGSLSHTYISAGTYTVTIKATDSGINGANKTIGSDKTTVTLAEYVISGLVTDSTPTPLAGVSLSLQLGGVTKKAVTTAANGTYTFTKVAPGSYTIVATKSGYTFASPAASPVVTNASVTGVNFSTNVASVVYVTGLVTNSTGTPVSGASMRLMNGTTIYKLKSTLTNGTYSFGSVADGTYTVVAVKAGYIFPAPPTVVVSGSSQAVPTISSTTP
jgi:hypothetical protein